MEIKTVRVSDKGQIAIPTSIREKIGIEKGDELVLFESKGKILIQKSKKISDIMEDDFNDVVKYNEDSLEEVWGNKQDDVWATYLRK